MRVALRLLVVTSLALLNLACFSTGGSERMDSEDLTTTVEGHGVTFKLPDQWDGRIEWISPLYVRDVHLASFSLPPVLDARGHEAERKMKPDDIYINLGIDPGFNALSPLPNLRVQPRDFQTEWEGKLPQVAVRATGHALVGGHFLQLWVSFGSHPTDATLSEVNRILATLVARPVSADS